MLHRLLVAPGRQRIYPATTPVARMILNYFPVISKKMAALESAILELHRLGR